MAPYVLPVAYTLFVWWFSTGAIVCLNRLAPWTFGWTLLAATGLLLLALLGLWVSRTDTRISGAYLAFTYGVVVWGWQEVAFLLGAVTGPRRKACPPGATGWRRAGYALFTVLHHEAALVVLGLAVLAVTWDGSNRTGLWTYMILWAMRQSAKLNVFLGVRNLNEQFLPAHLRYLQTYFLRRSMNSLFPISVLLATALAVVVWQSAAAAPTRFEATSLTFAATLLSLAILEHWFLVLPLPSEALWAWALRARERAPPKRLGTRSL